MNIDKIENDLDLVKQLSCIIQDYLVNKFSSEEWGEKMDCIYTICANIFAVSSLLQVKHESRKDFMETVSKTFPEYLEQCMETNYEELGRIENNNNR